MSARRRGRGVPERGMAGVCQQGEGGGLFLGGEWQGCASKEKGKGCS